MKNILLRFENIFILVLCYIYSVVRRGGNILPVISPKCVLIYHGGKLGDVVCATPVFRAIKEKYPTSRVVLVGSHMSKNINSELLRGNRDVDECDYLDRNNFFGNIKKIKKYNADYAFTLTPSFRELSILYLARIKNITAPTIENGWSPYETKSYKILTKLVHRVGHKMGNYAPGEYLRLLTPIGITSTNTKKHLLFSENAKQKVNTLISPHLEGGCPLIAIAPGAGNEIKKWNIDNWKGLVVKILQECEATIFLLGSDKDAKDTRYILDNIDTKNRVIDMAGKLSIEELKAFISRMNLFVSVDTGPIYIAEAFGIPTIDIVGPMDENEQPPRSDINKVIVAKREHPELHIMNSRVYDKKEARRQIDTIGVQEVFDVVLELVKK